MKRAFASTRLLLALGLFWVAVQYLPAARASVGPAGRGSNPQRVIYVVPDLPTFLYYLSTWDGDERFPIFMVSQGPYLEKFVRAYKPDAIRKPAARKIAPVDYNLLRGAVYASWGKETLPDVRRGVSRTLFANRLRELGRKPEGVILTNLDASQLPAALSLAAARRQLLDFLRLPSSVGRMDLSAAMSFEQKEEIRKEIIKIIERWGYSYKNLDDEIDYITLALDLPIAYTGTDHATGAKQRLCLDDAINRLTPDGSVPSVHPTAGGTVAETDSAQPLSAAPSLASPRQKEDQNTRGGASSPRGDCYAYVGRLIEADEGMALYQAMCSIFLGTSKALYFDRWPESWGLRAQEGSWVMQTKIHSILVKQSESSIARWRRLVGDLSPYGFVHISSAGNARQWGDGKVSDIPDTVPAIVYFAHSFSAADPYDPTTIAGRWLRNGAYIYFGAISEPYGQSFNAPRTVALDAVAGEPLGKAFQEKKMLPARFTFPWKQIYIGDPLHRIISLEEPDEPDSSRKFRRAVRMMREGNLGPAIELLEDVVESAEEPAERDRAWQALNRTFRLKFFSMRTGRALLSDDLDSFFVDSWYNDTYYPNGDPTPAVVLNRRLNLFQTELVRLYEALYRTVEKKPRLKGLLAGEIAEMKKGAAFAKIWLCAGPFTKVDDANPGNPFRPEKVLRLGATWQASVGEVRWQAAMANPENNYLDLASLYEGADSVIYSAYFPVLQKEEAVPARLHVSATDAVEVWLNNAAVGSVSAGSPEKNHEETVDLRLQPGENLLFLKVCRSAKRCRLSARLTDLNGNYLDDVSYADAVARLSAAGGKIDPDRWRPGK